MSKQLWSTLIAAFALALIPGPGFAQHAGMGGGGMPAGGSMGGAGSMSMPGAGKGMDRSAGMSAAMEERRMRAERLQRAHRELLDFDPHANLILRNEIVGLGATTDGIVAARSAGFVVARREALSGFDLEIIALTPPKGMSIKKALRRLAEIDPGATFDYNHIYFESAAASGSGGANGSGQGEPTPVRGQVPATGLRIGLIDGGVAANHPGLRSLKLHLSGCEGAIVPSAHGTAVASRLVAGVRDEAPAQIDVYAADVYCGAPTGGSTDAVVHALSWIVQEGASVINVSLVGPPNVLLQRVVASAIARGHLIVAAVGNDGPAAPPLYPAAYPGVIAVTGVDRKGRVLLESGRAPTVAFAAPAADIEAASLPDGYSSVRGTSYAAPIVASRLALLMDRPDSGAAQRAVNQLAAAAARPPGPRGRDPVYGYGCIGCQAPQLAVGHVSER